MYSLYDIENICKYFYLKVPDYLYDDIINEDDENFVKNTYTEDEVSQILQNIGLDHEKTPSYCREVYKYSLDDIIEEGKIKHLSDPDLYKSIKKNLVYPKYLDLFKNFEGRLTEASKSELLKLLKERDLALSVESLNISEIKREDYFEY